MFVDCVWLSLSTSMLESEPHLTLNSLLLQTLSISGLRH